ncbi:hypothetical protein ZHAS_00009747 [Anopheles sinensis]|uniref:Uncharacterized protein n=1 Tax=Anopheles sinensis TaxID=74873 RepID=A0A084VVU4_ANOSI|nr:hypothetical protein ZHAS_00009747 [Anopheles sinensis]
MASIGRKLWGTYNIAGGESWTSHSRASWDRGSLVFYFRETTPLLLMLPRINRSKFPRTAQDLWGSPFERTRPKRTLINRA